MTKRNSDKIILSIIWIVSICSLIISLIQHYEIGLSNFIGYGLLIIVTILRFYKIKRFKSILGIFLILGSINLFRFTFWTASTYFTISFLNKEYSALGFQPLSFLILIFFILANLSEIANIIQKFLAADPKTEMERQQTIEAKFYEEMKNKTDTYLIGITNNKGDYQTEFVKAAQKILNERNLNKNTL